MGRIACERYSANAIFHCDADEFWYPFSGSLKNELLARNRTDVLNVEVINMLYVNATGLERFPADTKYAVVTPLPSANIEADSVENSLYLFKYPGKVIYKTGKGYLSVGAGNHAIVNDDAQNLCVQRSKDIRILHYPVRGKQHFTQKVINGGSALEQNSSLGKTIGWQWRRWYEAYKNNRLDEQYALLTLSTGQVRTLLRKGVIRDWSWFQDKISRLDGA
jgi:hypothetical protein